MDIEQHNVYPGIPVDAYLVAECRRNHGVYDMIKGINEVCDLPSCKRQAFLDKHITMLPDCRTRCIEGVILLSYAIPADEHPPVAGSVVIRHPHLPDTRVHRIGERIFLILVDRAGEGRSAAPCDIA
ncbi:hypothetical protein DSECCO2_371220 [anaerobic digester metagenome]